ncbi:hypothetical protein Q5P01_016523 [Channa striata]|uniref:Uncharacterized protein n=1 Tax=Channa striata TaxID=64152 RepID=A0AA88MDQ0_CHASR|nr:hypothetical protein Q5P01_016523 [Channa striata]
MENKEPPPKRKLSSAGDNAAAKFTDKIFTVPSKSDVPLASDYTVYTRNAEQVSAQTDPQCSDVMITSNPNTENIEQVSAQTDPHCSDVMITSDPNTENIEQVSAQTDPQRSDMTIASNPNTENIEMDPQCSYLVTPDPDDENIEQKLTLLQKTDLSTCQV